MTVVPATPAVPTHRAGFVTRLRAASSGIPLFWKMLVPPVIVGLVMGSVLLFWAARFVAGEDQRRAESVVQRRSNELDARLADRLVDLRETALTAANLIGVPEAVAGGDAPAIERALVGLASVRARVPMVSVVDRSGRGIVDVVSRGQRVRVSHGVRWRSASPVATALAADARDLGARYAGVARAGGAPLIVVASPVVSGGVTVGASVATLPLQSFIDDAARRVASSIAIFGPRGSLLGSSGPAPGSVSLPNGATVVRRASDGSVILYAPLVMGGRSAAGTVALTVAGRDLSSSAQGTGLRMAAFTLAGITLLIAASSFLARGVTQRLGRMAAVSRALGRGDLSARVIETGRDELGELADRLNAMAQDLAVAERELERQVAARTEELRLLHAESSAALERQEEGLALLSHEFRNPLFAISGLAELTLDEDMGQDLPAWVQEFAATIKASADELLLQVNSILELSRMERRPAAFVPEPVSLAEVLDHLDPTLRALGRRAEVAVDIAVAPDLPRVLGEARRLGEVVLNLASNALKYTPSGGATSIRAHADDGCVVVTVTDTGVGIPDDALASLFEPFYRVEGTRAQKGQPSSGLGLTITKRLVDDLAGDISVRSVVGAGTTFEVRLPAHVGAGEGAGARHPTGQTSRRRRRPSKSAAGARSLARKG